MVGHMTHSVHTLYPVAMDVEGEMFCPSGSLKSLVISLVLEVFMTRLLSSHHAMRCSPQSHSGFIVRELGIGRVDGGTVLSEQCEERGVWYTALGGSCVQDEGWGSLVPNPDLLQTVCQDIQHPCAQRGVKAQDVQFVHQLVRDDRVKWRDLQRASSHSCLAPQGALGCCGGLMQWCPRWSGWTCVSCSVQSFSMSSMPAVSHVLVRSSWGCQAGQYQHLMEGCWSCSPLRPWFPSTFCGNHCCQIVPQSVLLIRPAGHT